MEVTNTDNQEITFRKNLKILYSAFMHKEDIHHCPVKDMLAPSVDKWSLLCLYNIAFSKVLRFNELKRYVPGISSRMLSVTLKRLEAHELIKRKAYPEVPPRVEYELTEFGYGFGQRIAEINVWIYDQKQKLDPVKE